MSLANTTKNFIESKCSDCFSLYAGYGMTGGEYVRFPQGAQLSEKRNEKGRVIKAVYKYADGSVLRYSYSDKTQRYRLTVN